MNFDISNHQVCRVGSWRGSGFDDADVSSLPPIISYGGFSPVRLEEEVPISQMQPSLTVPWLKCDPHIHHGPSRFTAPRPSLL